MNLSSDTLAYLGLASLAIGATVRAIKTDTANGLLERFGFGPIPKRALPWVALGLGLVGGIVAALQQHQTLAESVATAFGGIVSGGGAVAGHQLVIESIADGNEIGGSKP